METALLVAVLASTVFSLASSDPQTNKLIAACSQYNATSASTFIATVNSALSDINASIYLSNFSNFVTASKPQSATSIYALFMCRSYLVHTDCKKCFTTAAK
jgi:Salt stress response/antifungal